MSSKARAALPPLTKAAQFLVHDAGFRLARYWASASAFQGVTRTQKFVLFALAAFLIAFVCLAPELFFESLRYSLIAGFLSLAGLKVLAVFCTPKKNSPPPLKDNDLPFYTVLVPLYDEASVLPRLIKHLKNISYPPYKLDIKLLIEDNDAVTLKAIKSLRLDGRFQILPIPQQGPKTKPKALNYGLAFALGDLVTVYDAEDEPHPWQLREAAAAFAKAGEKLTYLQAPLGFYNSHHNVLTRQFTLEYAFHFHVFLPFLARVLGAFPLGGTSNHIRTDHLRQAGGWDPFNVTEDADLGFRLAALGWHGDFITSGTQEEAVCQVMPWIRQRTRWQKGFLQSWFVHMRHPLHFLRQGRSGAFWALHLSLGADFISSLLYAPLMLVVAGVVCVSGINFIRGEPVSLHPLDLFVFVTGFGAHALASSIALYRLGKPDLIPGLLITPFYWFLRTGAALYALWDVIKRPFHWHKTPHGLS